MKMILLPLLCLILACRPEPVKTEAPEPCLASLMLPYSTFEIYLPNLNKKYQYFADNNLVWDDCANTSDFHIYEVKVTPISSPEYTFIKTIQGNLDPFTYGTTRIKIYELDSSCLPLAMPLVDLLLDVNEENYSMGSGVCKADTIRRRLTIGI